jgi:vacuolar-type H+-ATPase subunit I/STV1
MINIFTNQFVIRSCITSDKKVIDPSDNYYALIIYINSMTILRENYIQIYKQKRADEEIALELQIKRERELVEEHEARQTKIKETLAIANAVQQQYSPDNIANTILSVVNEGLNLIKNTTNSNMSRLNTQTKITSSGGWCCK